MRSALDYVGTTSGDKLNRRVLSLCCGIMAFARAEMLAAPSKPAHLDEVEGMTKQGHGPLYSPIVGSAFLQPVSYHSGSRSLDGIHPDIRRKRPRSISDFEKLPKGAACTLRDLFACMPEIDDLFVEAFGGPAGWIAVAYDSASIGSFRGSTRRGRGRIALMDCSQTDPD
jgi:hypothetical protein